MTPVREALKEARALISATPASALNYDAPYDEYYALLERIDEALSAAPGEPCAWVKRLADNWRGRRDSLTGDSVRDSCADELEKVAACHATPQPAAGWTCLARKQSLPEPAECNWPDCGCDPHATKVIESLVEQGWTAPREAPAPAEAVTVELEPWRDELSEIVGHLGAAIVQSCAKDDQIIMDHVKAAHEIAKIVRRKA